MQSYLFSRQKFKKTTQSFISKRQEKIFKLLLSNKNFESLFSPNEVSTSWSIYLQSPRLFLGRLGLKLWKYALVPRSHTIGEWPLKVEQIYRHDISLFWLTWVQSPFFRDFLCGSQFKSSILESWFH